MERDKQSKVCNRCVMDTSANKISFNSDGVCNFCIDFEKRYPTLKTETKEAKAERLKKLISEIKKNGRNKEYDCVVGVSGGIDSSYTLVKAVELGLKPLAVHMDNGWNSELAQNNIANIVKTLDIDLHTHVINWTEYKDLMQAFFDADVIDIELLYDNAMLAVNYKFAEKYKLKYVLSGSNTVTEGMSMPEEWNWLKFDKKNIISILKTSKNTSLKTYPSISTVDFVIYKYLKKINWVPFLDYIEYDKENAKLYLTDKYNFKPYSYKHYESIFTRFYQGFILPQKFKIDKRKLHLSSLIMSGQITRQEAMVILSKDPYPTAEELKSDKEYFLKKMGWNSQALGDYLGREEKKHDIFGSEKVLWTQLCKIRNTLQKRLLK